jgi:Na+/proline symporter
MYPLFVIETLGRFAGLTGLFICSILSATLSTFSSGFNSMATVILEDIYKSLSTKVEISNEDQLIFSKLLCKLNWMFCFFKLSFVDLISGIDWLFNIIYCIYCILYGK